MRAGYEYSRSKNPTRDSFEAQVAACENGKYCLAFASGSAVTASILMCMTPGSHVISVDDVYGGTQRYMNRVSNPQQNVSFSFIDFNEEGLFEKTITKDTKLVWIETPTNPTLKITDIKKVCDIAHKHGITVVIDNTFMSPFFQRPLDLGADIVMHSVTKYINGHSDIVMGVAVCNSLEWRTKLAFMQNCIGAIPSPFDCYMAQRGLKTLHIRMAAHEKNAIAVAQFLETHPKVKKVVYPGLKSHPQHDIACKQMTGFGGMITFFIKGGLKQADQFLSSTKLFLCAESLGAVECLAESPAIMTHASVPAEMRAKLGIDDSLIRLSVGIEDIRDIMGDLNQAFDKVEL
jgi:cystathionine gamma-lyase